MPTPKADLGAGVSTAVKAPTSAADKQLQHGATAQTARALSMGSFFLTGVMAINMSQVMGAPLYLINKDWYNAWIAFTKQSIGLLFTTMTQFWAPTTVEISGDKSMRGQLHKTIQGNLFCDFPERLIFIANHQIYTDWLYLWWIAYASGMHGRIYIVLKESLRRIPLIGWGMQFSKFIFLKRNWEQDKPNLARHLRHLNDPKEPMWLTLFPEGTNLAPSTRRASTRWAEKQGINDLRHCLLPRSTGLQFILEQLRDTTEWVYDCTIAYEGVPRGQYAQDIYTIRAQYMGGRRPKAVSMHFRRFKVSSIPLGDSDAFDKWLRARWAEKDNLLEYYMQNGHFPADKGAEKYADGTIKRGTGHIQAEVKAHRWYEFLQVFAPMGLLAMVLYSFYGALPKQILKKLQRQAIAGVQMARRAGQLGHINEGHIAGPQFNITNKEMAMLKKAIAEKNVTINQETIQKALEANLLKPKNGLPGGGSEQLAITNQALKNAADIFSTKKGLTSAEKRARARQRLEAQKALALLPPPDTTPGQQNGTAKAPPSTLTQKQVTVKPAVTPPSKNAVTTTTPSRPAANPKAVSMPNGVVKKTAPPVNKTVVKSSATAQKPTTSTAASNAPATATKSTIAPKKQIPKLGPSSASSDTRSVTSSSSSKSIPKLEIRSKPQPPSQPLPHKINAPPPKKISNIASNTTPSKPKPTPQATTVKPTPTTTTSKGNTAASTATKGSVPPKAAIKKPAASSTTPQTTKKVPPKLAGSAAHV